VYKNAQGIIIGEKLRKEGRIFDFSTPEIMGFNL